MVSEKSTFDGIEVSAFEESVYLTLEEGDGSQYCADVMTIVKTLVQIRGRSNLEVGAVKRKFGNADPDGFTNDNDIVTAHFGDTSELHEAHMTLVEKVEEIVNGLKEDDYWTGYRDGSGSSWSDIAWKAVKKEFEGSIDLSLQLGEMFIEWGLVPCNRKNALFPIGKWGRPDGSYVATLSLQEVNKCTGCGSDLSETKEVVESPASTRRGTKYKCTCCDKTWRGITTG